MQGGYCVSLPPGKLLALPCLENLLALIPPPGTRERLALSTAVTFYQVSLGWWGGESKALGLEASPFGAGFQREIMIEYGAFVSVCRRPSSSMGMKKHNGSVVEVSKHPSRLASRGFCSSPASVWGSGGWTLQMFPVLAFGSAWLWV